MPVSASPVLAAARKSLGNKAYAALIAEAHKRGYKAESYVQGKATGTPEGMLERTQRSLRDEAQKSVNAAYAPAEGSLNTALQREQALNDKRDRDLANFQQWSSGQQQRFQQAAYAAQAQILTQNQEILAQAGAARAQSNAAIQAQLAPMGGDLASSAENALKMNPTSAAAQGAAAQMVAADAARATAAAQRGTDSLEFMGTNQLGAVASIREQARLAGDERRQKIIDQIAELGSKKAGTFAESLQALTDNEQKKVLSKYENDVASAIASGKQAFTAKENALDRGLKVTLATDAANTKIALANAKRDADKVKYDASQYKDAVAFKAKYGKTQEEIAGMSSADLQTYMKQWRKTTGAGGKIAVLTPDQKNRNERFLEDAIRRVREAHGHKSEADIRRMLRGGRDANPAVFGDKGRAPMDPDLVNAAIDIVFRHGLSDLNRRRLSDPTNLGVDVTRYGRAKTKKHSAGSK